MRIPRDSDKLIAEGKLPHTAQVYLNGGLISHVHEVDDEEGWVETLKYDDGGTHGVKQEGRVVILFPGDKGYQDNHIPLGQVAFDAYNEDRGGVNYLGQPTPKWRFLPEEIRHAWEVAGTAAVIHEIKRLVEKGKLLRVEEGGITNRERWIVRELFRNSYERAESEIDEIIVDTLKDVDVDALHQQRLEEDAETARTRDW